jgi:hypothetical protein
MAGWKFVFGQEDAKLLFFKAQTLHIYKENYLLAIIIFFLGKSNNGISVKQMLLSLQSAVLFDRIPHNYLGCGHHLHLFQRIPMYSGASFSWYKARFNVLP